MQAGVGGRATRIIVVLAIALGVLAMHGLGGGHHGSATAAPTAVAATAAADHASGAVRAAEHAGHQLLAVGAASLAPLNAEGVMCDGDCSEHSSGLLLLCVAILIAAAGAMALRRGARTWQMAPETGPRARAGTSTAAPSRRLDLVAELCISRT